MYKINPKSYGSVFVLPTEITDKHLRLAGKAQLKVLLWLFRNQPQEIDNARLAKDTGIPGDEIDDALLYWVEAGIIIDAQAPAEAPSAPPAPKAETPKAPTAVTVEQQPEKAAKPVQKPFVKPSIMDIANRLASSEEIRNMFGEAQNILGRTLGYDGQSCLLLLRDYYGLPSDVILMLCGYAKTIGKEGSLNYIMKTGESWANEEITTFDAAEKKIARLESASDAWSEFKSLTGLQNPRPTAKQAEYLEIWISDYGFGVDVLYLAYEKTVEQKGAMNLRYMNGILSSWNKDGLKTVEAIEKAELDFASSKKEKSESSAQGGKKSGSSQAPSYDYSLAIKQSLALDPTKTKRGQ